MRVRLLLVAATVLALWLGTAMAEDPNARSALERVEKLESELKFAEIVETLQPYADTQHRDVEYYLAWAYLNLAINGRAPGQIALADIQPAIRFAHQAADHGSTQAWNLLYMIYGNGYGVPVDGPKAVGFLQRGANAGDAGAKLNYAIQLYEGSPIVDQDLGKSCAFFNELAQDDGAQVMASYYLGMILFRGQCGTRANKESGVKLIELSANHGVRAAERDMGRNHEFGWTGPADMKAAFGWYEKAAEHGDPHSQWRLGVAYVRGEMRARDSVKAVHLFEQAAASDYGDGLTSLAVMYATGDSVAQDYGKAKDLYQRAVEQGSIHALQNLSAMHLFGQGMPADPVRARLSYLQSIELGDAEHPQLREAIDSAIDADGIKQSDLLLEAWRAQRNQHRK